MSDYIITESEIVAGTQVGDILVVYQRVGIDNNITVHTLPGVFCVCLEDL